VSQMMETPKLACRLVHRGQPGGPLRRFALAATVFAVLTWLAGVGTGPAARRRTLARR
jgi:hypothetical protein